VREMAWAICVECGCPVSWPARRGHRLKDYKCPKCHGRLRRSTHDEAVKAMAKHGGFYDYYVDRWISKDYYEEQEKRAGEEVEKLLRGGVVFIKWM